MMNLNILFPLLITLSASTTVAQSVTETRQTVVPAPAFVLTPPVSATPEDLEAGEVEFSIENLSAKPINVRLEGTFTPTAAAPGTPTAAPPVILTTPEEITLESRESAQYPINGSGSGNIVVTASIVGGGYKTSSRVTVKPAPFVGTSLLALLKTTHVAASVFESAAQSNNILPLKSKVAIPCIGQGVGWVSGDQGSAPIVAMPYPTPATCVASDKAEVSQLQLKIAEGHTLASGSYSGTLNLGYDGGGEKDRVKLELLQTWSWAPAVLAIVLGVVTGFLYRLWSGRAGAVQADRTNAAAYQAAALTADDAVAKSQPNNVSANALRPGFRVNVDTEYKNILAVLDAERGLTRDAEKAKLMAARLAIFQSTASNYGGLVAAFTALRAIQINTPHLNTKVEELLAQPAPTVVQLSAVRLKAEGLLTLVPIWNTLEETVQAVLSDLDVTQNQFLSVYHQITAVPAATLALQVAQDLRDSTVAAAQARRGLDNADPTPAATAEIQQAMDRALDTLVAVKINLPLLVPPSFSVAGVQPVTAPSISSSDVAALSSGATAEVPTPLQQALLVLRHQRAMLFKMNISIALITLVIALVSGLGELYWGKAFGWTQAFQAFAWGFGLKIGLDNVYLALDHFIFNTNQRLLPSTAQV